MNNDRTHAVVIGASMAGLLAARVLSEQYAQVTLLDRDPLTPHAPRRGVPQSQQPHALLLRGKQILEELYPGLERELLESGALIGDITGDTRLVTGTRNLAKTASGVSLLFASRHLIETQVRARTLALPNVQLRGAVTVRGLKISGGDRVRGVQLDDGVLDADLVVDASGRGSRTPTWLQEMGFTPPTESRLQVNVTYTSRLYHRRPEHLDGDLMLLTFPEQPKDRRVVGCFAVEGDRWHVMLTGWHGEQAPMDDAGFLEFARGFEHPDIHPLLASLEPAGPATMLKYPANSRRHYERLKRFPEGLLVIGDALCSFNPTYGQGMTVAALEALALRTALKGHGAPLWQRYFRLARPVIDVPWNMVTGGDSSYPESQWKQPMAARMIGQYFRLIQRAAQTDPVVMLAFMQVAHMVQPPTLFFTPGFMWRVRRALRTAPSSRTPDVTALLTT